MRDASGTRTGYLQLDGAMSDGDLRLLERAWRESGSEADEVAYLRARVRAGLLKVEALERADVLGHAPARTALDELAELRHTKAGKRGDRGKRKTSRPHQPGDQDHHGGVFWVIGLEAWGREACVRGAVALARLTMPLLAGSPHEARLALRAIEAAEAWVVDPTEEAERLAEEQAGRVVGSATPAGHAAACARFAAQAAGQFIAERGPGVAIMRGDFEAARRTGAGEAVLDAASNALRAGCEASQIRYALRADLVPWVLGYSDPVRERVSKLAAGDVRPDDLAL